MLSLLSRPCPPPTHPVARAGSLALLLVAMLTVGTATPALAITPAPEHLPQTPVVDTTPQEIDLTFPVAGVSDVRFSNDFLALRGGGSRLHAATDLMAPKHRAIVAAVGGTISFAPNPEPSYGWMLTIHGDDGRRYSYVHLNNDTPTKDSAGRWLDDDAGGIEHAYAPRITAAIETFGRANGLRVERGEVLGWNGDSGNAKGVTPHLHFEIHVEGDDGWHRINPYHSLVAARDRDDVAAASVRPRVPETDWRQHGGLFADVNPAGTHGPAVERLTSAGVLRACTSERYCPLEPMVRGDLARAFAKVLELDVPRWLEEAPFPDVTLDDRRAAAIAAVDAAGILTGYTDGTFGPDEPLTRAQLASVLVRAFEVPPAVEPMGFADVRPDGPHTAAIDAIARAGITLGCAGGEGYCGGVSVQRDQIATFLERGVAFGRR
jgi:murein DD-endopeptidase MepM/ murein hydrolase activator NlpD